MFGSYWPGGGAGEENEPPFPHICSCTSLNSWPGPRRNRKSAGEDTVMVSPLGDRLLSLPVSPSSFVGFPDGSVPWIWEKPRRWSKLRFSSITTKTCSINAYTSQGEPAASDHVEDALLGDYFVSSKSTTPVFGGPASLGLSVPTLAPPRACASP